MLPWWVNSDTFCVHSGYDALPSSILAFVSHTHKHTDFASTLSASLMSDHVPQQEFYWLHCTYNCISHWTKWIYGLWNHSRGVMMNYHWSVLAFVAIKHTDGVGTVNLLTLWNMKSCNRRVRMHCTSSPPFSFIQKPFFSQTVYIFIISKKKHLKAVHAGSVLNNSWLFLNSFMAWKLCVYLCASASIHKTKKNQYFNMAVFTGYCTGKNMLCMIWVVNWSWRLVQDCKVGAV